jgi:hypothetical protein
MLKVGALCYFQLNLNQKADFGMWKSAEDLSDPKVQSEEEKHCKIALSAF